MPDAEEVKQLLMLDATNVVPCLGAGSSLKVYCDWDELCQKLLEVSELSDLPPINGHNNLEVVEAIQLKKGSIWVAQTIRERFEHGIESKRGSVPRAEHLRPKFKLQALIGNAGFPFVITTNFDTSLEESGGAFQQPLYRRDMHLLSSQITGPLTPLVKIQGDITQLGQNELIMGYPAGERDCFRSSMVQLRQQLRTRHVIFLGCKFESHGKLGVDIGRFVLGLG